MLDGLPAILVMPDGGKAGMYMDWYDQANPRWATYHLTVLRREIERRYPIRAGRRQHAIAGISMGGQGTLRYAEMLPGYFGSAAGFSAAIPDMQTLEAQVGITALLSSYPGVSYEKIFGPPSGPYATGTNPMTLASNLGHTRLYLTSGNGINCPQDPMNPNSFALDVVTEGALNAQQPRFAEAAHKAGADATFVPTCGVHTFGVWDDPQGA